MQAKTEEYLEEEIEREAAANEEFVEAVPACCYAQLKFESWEIF